MRFHEDQNRVHQLLHENNTSTKIAFSALKPIQQAAITLSLRQKQSIANIADILGLSEQSVVYLYRQAFQTMSAQMHKLPLQCSGKRIQ
jgi:DNA-directed RNA polymerase specialized sigma24 family protein